MIIYLIFILAVLVILSWTMIKNRALRWTVGIITSLCLLGASGILTLTFTDTHLGMHKVTTTTTSKVYSATGNQSPANILIAKRLGTKADRYVLVYRDSAAVKKATTHGVPNQDHIASTVKKKTTYKLTNGTSATATTKTTRWEWKNKTTKFWLNVGQGGTLVSKKTVVKVPKTTWLVLSPSQVKQLRAKLKAAAASGQTSTTTAAAAASGMSKDQLDAAAVTQIKTLLAQSK